MKVLCVDDSSIDRYLLETVVEDLGYVPISAETGEDALIQGTLTSVDLAIIDIRLTGIDGFETARQLRGSSSQQSYPIIFISSDPDEELHDKWLDFGDDFISKPLNSSELSAKVRYHIKISELSKEMQAQNQMLEQYRQIIQSEHNAVATIFEQQIEKYLVELPDYRFHMSPASAFNGDVLLTDIGPTGNFVIAVGDVTGHGLASAVGALPIYPMFRTMVRKGIKVGTIAYEMNRMVRSILPSHMMLAMAIVEVNAESSQLEVWSGGMPSMIVDDGTGKLKLLIESTHAPLSALPCDEFARDIQFFDIDRGDRLYLFTDGLHESTNSDGEMFGEPRLINAFDGAYQDMFNEVLRRVTHFSGETDQEDDITLVEYRFPEFHHEIEERPSIVDSQLQERALTWSSSIALTTEDLKKAEPVPQIVNVLSKVQGCAVHADYISTILSELYSNALEHGVLGLDSSLKNGEDGFFVYYEERRQRLESLDSGSITIDIKVDPNAQPPFMDLMLTDSGPGFEFDKLMSADYQESRDTHGRGIMLVKDLCDEVAYDRGGSRVTVRYLL